VPIVAQLVLLAILAVAIMDAAFPDTHPAATQPQPAQKEQGVAARGWFQEAEKEFHH
jgi:hypothetical protein